jgi:hypothetical protein
LDRVEKNQSEMQSHLNTIFNRQMTKQLNVKNKQLIHQKRVHEMKEKNKQELSGDQEQGH